MIFTYEKRFATFKKWFHINFNFENLVVAEFCHESDIKNFITCSKCDLKLNNWKFKRDSKKAHMRQSSNCLFFQDKKETSINATSTKSASIKCIAFSPQILYLIIENLYQRQKILIVKIDFIEAKKAAIIAQKIMKQEVIAVFKQSSKTKTEFFKSFKFEKFTITFSSTSTKSRFERTSYEERLVIFTNWSHVKFSATDVIEIKFCHKSNTKDIITCSKCSFKWFEWCIDENFLQIHLMKNDCSLIRALKLETKKASLVARKIINQEVVAALKSSSKFQKLDEFETKRTSRIVQKTADQEVVIVNLKLRSKIKFSKFFESFKFETFIINFSSTSTISNLESIIKSDAALITSSILANEAIMNAKKAAAIIQKIIKQKAVAVIDAVKSEICVKNIKFFDFTMFLNLLDFQLSVNSACFLHHLIEIVVNYQKKSVLKILFQCLRDSALTWFKYQFQFISLNEFKTIIAKIFSSIELVVNFDRAIIDSSSQKYQRYHICFNCFAQFSSTSRFLIHAQKSCFKIFTCKFCEKIMTSNNKLHEHVRLHHKFKTLKQRFVEEENNHIDLSITIFIASRISRKTIATNSKAEAKSSRCRRINRTFTWR